MTDLPASAASVMRLAQCDADAFSKLLARFGIELQWLADGEPIPGSYWGESEAGLVGNSLYVRGDTPLHSALHEGCHFICMDERRRTSLERDAGGDFDEENAVCYLQILLADSVPGLARERMWADMDAWGYTFRLGSARAWFENDADDARQWLAKFGIIDAACRVSGKKRDQG